MNVKIKRLNGYDRVIECMPDKSMSIRAVIFNAYAVGRATVKNLLLSDDVMSAIDCVRRLGATVELDGNTAKISGAAFSGCSLDCGNSGTTARLLMGLLSGLNGVYTIDGDESLRSRPMKRVIDPLRAMGADITDRDGRLPVRIVGSGLDGMTYDMPIASAQVKSALILAGLNARSPVTVVEPIPSRNHTETMLGNMNISVDRCGNSVSVAPGVVYARDFDVPGDISSAAYPICLALMTGGRCVVKNVGVNVTRTGIIDVLREMGADVEYSNLRGTAEPIADITVAGGRKLKPFRIDGEIMPRLVDEIPVLCALACTVDGESVVTGGRELKVKETDRIATTVAALTALGADITPTDDGMIVRGGKRFRYGVVDPKLDHRIAMAAAVAAASGEGGVIVDGECASVSYPNFYDEVIA